MSKKSRIKYSEFVPQSGQAEPSALGSRLPADGTAEPESPASEPPASAAPPEPALPPPVALPEDAGSPLSIARRLQRLSGEHGVVEVAASIPTPEPVVAQAPGAESRAPAASRETSAERRVPLSLRDKARQRTGTADLLVFRVGRELFGVELPVVDEAVDTPVLHPLPAMDEGMLGVFSLRGALVSLFAPARALGVRVDRPATALILRADAAPGASAGSRRRVALAADDVDDVLTVDLEVLRETPGVDTTDGILLGVVRRGRDLVGVLDTPALLAACQGASLATSSPPPESP